MATAACFGASPHMGTWKLNEAKSKLPEGMGKNTTVTYAEQGDKIKVTVDCIGKDEKATHGVWVGKWDGKAYPTKSKGDVGWNSSAYKVVNDHTNDITTWKDGKVAWSGRITVAADGKSRTVTTTSSSPLFTKRASMCRGLPRGSLRTYSQRCIWPVESARFL